jgi:fructose-1,6-bisphosphatase I
MQGLTLNQHIRRAQKLHPDAKGELSALLTAIGVAGKVISSKVNMAGLVKILGTTGTINVQGEVVQKLDEYAEEIIQEIVGDSGQVCALMSEERKSVMEIPREHAGKYLVAYDPLDGSSNIDANVTIGTIFAIFKKQSPGTEITRSDVMQPGRQQVAAGYILYGSSTIMVYSAGDGVHGFTLDPQVGEYILSHEDIRLDGPCAALSINYCNAPYWPDWVHTFTQQMIERNDTDKRRVNGRHIGSLVADFHRNMLYGGVFLYPAQDGHPDGKLRLLYEAAPLAMIAEQAGGYASNGDGPILQIQPDNLHQRVPLYIGSRETVLWIEKKLADPTFGAGH